MMWLACTGEIGPMAPPCNSIGRRFEARAIRPALILCALLSIGVRIEAPTPAIAVPLSRSALIVGESDPSSGAPTTFTATLGATLSALTPYVAVYGETLDLSRFAQPGQESILRTYVREKYSDVHFGVVIAVGLKAFEIVRRWRSELWPGVPVVF